MDVELVQLDRHLGDQLLQLAGVGQVAVVAERDGSVGGGPEGRLRVVPGACAGGGVARVPDRDVALERCQRGLVEDLGDQAHVLVDEDLAAVADRDAGRLLAAVLQGVEAVVGQLGDVLPGAHTPKTPQASWGARSWGSRSCVRSPSPRRRAPGFLAEVPWAGRAGVIRAGHGPECTCLRELLRAPPGWCRSGVDVRRDGRLTAHRLASRHAVLVLPEPGRVVVEERPS